jgi:hypothetical protein
MYAAVCGNLKHAVKFSNDQPTCGISLSVAVFIPAPGSETIRLQGCIRTILAVARPDHSATM